MLIPAFYFDGRTSRRHSVCLKVEDEIAVISGDAERRCPIADLRISEKLRSASRKLTFPDGAYLEILDNRSFDALLKATGYREPLPVRMQQSWRGSLLAAAATFLILLTGYHYGLPVFARLAAEAIPDNVERGLGLETLALLDQRMLAPTELPEARREAIRRRFASLVTLDGRPHQAELIFRKSRIGPNALALPSGQIVLTDQLVQRLESEDAIVAVLGHELGHLQQRHLLRRLVQGSVTAAVATLLFGDVSAVAANIPTLLVDLKYSRDAELEADDYALKLLQANGLGRRHMAAALEALEAPEANRQQEAGYLSTHPSTADRVARIRVGADGN